MRMVQQLSHINYQLQAINLLPIHSKEKTHHRMKMMKTATDLLCLQLKNHNRGTKKKVNRSKLKDFKRIRYSDWKMTSKPTIAFSMSLFKTSGTSVASRMF